MFLENFTCVYKKRVILTKPIYPENILFIQGIYKNIYILDRNDILNSPVLPESWSDLHEISHTLYTDEIIRYYHYYSDNIVYPYVSQPNTVNVLEEPVHFIRSINQFCLSHHKWERASLICKLEQCENNTEYYDVCYYVQTRIIERILQQKREPKSNMFFNLVEKNQLEKLFEKYQTELHTIYNKSENNENAKENVSENKDISNARVHDHLQKFTNPNFSYFRYQERDIHWMKRIENEVDNGTNVLTHTYSSFYPILNNQYFVQNGIVYPTDMLNLQDCSTTEEHKFYGGNLISETGLGKTLITYGHILHTRDDTFDKYIEIENTCNYFYKRGTKRGMSCSSVRCENSFYCLEHKNAIFIDKPKLRLKQSELTNVDLKTDFTITDLASGMRYLKTNSTLVICPNQLCDQWTREYYNNLSGLRVITLVTYEQFKNLTLADILFSDVVIV